WGAPGPTVLVGGGGGGGGRGGGCPLFWRGFWGVWGGPFFPRHNPAIANVDGGRPPSAEGRSTVGVNWFDVRQDIDRSVFDGTQIQDTGIRAVRHVHRGGAINREDCHGVNVVMIDRRRVAHGV